MSYWSIYGSVMGINCHTGLYNYGSVMGIKCHTGLYNYASVMH